MERRREEDVEGRVDGREGSGSGDGELTGEGRLGRAQNLTLPQLQVTRKCSMNATSDTGS